jgi:phosphocarrier protein
MFMKEKEVTVVIPNRLGLHARPASRFAGLASEFDARILLIKNGKEVDGKSILEILTLASPKGSSLTIKAEGKDAEKAVNVLKTFVESGFGEMNL